MERAARGNQGDRRRAGRSGRLVREFTHWIVINLPADTLSLAAGVDPTTLGAKIGQNDFHNVRYNGPCPPRGDLHRYRFRVYAADYVLPLNEGATRANLAVALSGHVLGVGALTATFAH